MEVKYVKGDGYVCVGNGGYAITGRGGTATAGNVGTATVGAGGTATAGDHGKAIAGDHGTANAGDWGTATAGDYGTVTVGYGGTAKAKYAGVVTAGDVGNASTGDDGTATAGYGGTARAGRDGTATAGNNGTAIVAYGGTAIVGDSGAAIAGFRGIAQAGKGGTINIMWFDDVNDRYRQCIGYVGENGIKADTLYRVDGGNLVKVEVGVEVEETPEKCRDSLAECLTPTDECGMIRRQEDTPHTERNAMTNTENVENTTEQKINDLLENLSEFSPQMNAHHMVYLMGDIKERLDNLRSEGERPTGERQSEYDFRMAAYGLVGDMIDEASGILRSSAGREC